MKVQNSEFKWQPYLSAVEESCKLYGIIPEILDKSKSNTAIKKMFLKDNSIIKILNLSFRHHFEQKLTIKLEIDTNPPKGSTTEIKTLSFPVETGVELQDLPSNFAGKSHALLCRNYLKGRDWYDFLWYIQQDVTPNLVFLKEAIHQTGPWQGQNIEVTPDWYLAALKEKSNTIDWTLAAKDVHPFLNERYKKTLLLWDKEFFTDKAQKLKSLFC